MYPSYLEQMMLEPKEELKRGIHQSDLLWVVSFGEHYVIASEK